VRPDEGRAPVWVGNRSLVLADVEAWCEVMRLAGAEGNSPAYGGTSPEGRMTEMSGWPAAGWADPGTGRLVAVLAGDLAALLAAADGWLLGAALQERIGRLEDAVGRAGLDVAPRPEGEADDRG
jgi:hypothetical protein